MEEKKAPLGPAGLYNDKKTSDVEVRLGQETLYLHMLFLFSRSTVLEAALLGKLNEAQTNKIDFSDNPYCPVLAALFRYLYTDTLEVDDGKLGLCWAAIHYFGIDDGGLVEIRIFRGLQEGPRQFLSEHFHAIAPPILDHAGAAVALWL